MELLPHPDTLPDFKPVKLIYVVTIPGSDEQHYQVAADTSGTFTEDQVLHGVYDPLTGSSEFMPAVPLSLALAAETALAPSQ